MIVGLVDKCNLYLATYQEFLTIKLIKCGLKLDGY